jgi:hypothetical protein
MSNRKPLIWILVAVAVLAVLEFTVLAPHRPSPMGPRG